MAKNTQRQEIASWLMAFSIINTLILYCAGYFFIKEMSLAEITTPLFSNADSYLYFGILSLIYLSLFACIAIIPNALLLLVNHIFPKKLIIISLSICITTMLIFYTILDAAVIKTYKFHLDPIFIFRFFGWDTGTSLGLSGYELGFLFITISLILLIEISIAKLLWRPKKLLKWAHLRKWLFALLLIGYLLANAGFYIGKQRDLNLLNHNTYLLPLFSEWLLPLPYLNNYQSKGSYLHFSHDKNTKLIYPLHPVICGQSKKPMNILILAIDAWRFDSFNARVTPQIFQFLKNKSQFHHHLSGGNTTINRMFLMFYSLPSTEWLEFYNRKQGPIFFKLLNQQHYQLGVFTSDSSERFAADVTSFRDVENLMLGMPGDTPFELDKNTTKHMVSFLKKRDKNRPFFGFVFYNSAHSYCAAGMPYYKFLPSIKTCNRLTLNNDTDPMPYFNRYRNALYYVNNEMGEILETLKQEKLLDNTIVIITSDHGEEFNDTHRNLWGHTSGYTDVQLQIPLIIHWPGGKPKHIHYTTTNYDLAPTLIREALSCDSPMEDYSIGHNLFEATTRMPFISSNYTNFSIRETDQIDRFFSDGQILIEDNQGQIIPKKKVSLEIINFIHQQARKFFKNEKTNAMEIKEKNTV